MDPSKHAIHKADAIRAEREAARVGRGEESRRCGVTVSRCALDSERCITNKQ